MRSEIKEEGYLDACIAPVYQNRAGIVTIVQDDGVYKSGDILVRLAEKYQIRVTIAGTVRAIRSCFRYWKRVERKGVAELVSHSWSHVKLTDEVSKKVLRHEIRDSIIFFKCFFKTDQIAFVPPEAYISKKGEDILKRSGIYAVRRGEWKELNSLSPEEGFEFAHWYFLGCHGIGSVECEDERRRWIDEAIQCHKWLIEMWHRISENGEIKNYQEITTQVAEDHIKYIAEKSRQEEIWVATLTEATKYLYEKQHCVVSARFEEKKIHVKLVSGDVKVSSKVFNHPLTVKVYLPKEWGGRLYLLNRKGNIALKTEAEKRYLQFDMLPNTKEVIIDCKE